MEPDDSPSSPTWRYGDVPELFWDAQPDVAIDVRNPVVLARLLTRGRAEIIGKLVTLEVLREELDAVALPENVLLFWQAVLRTTVSGAAGTHSLGEDS